VEFPLVCPKGQVSILILSSFYRCCPTQICATPNPTLISESQYSRLIIDTEGNRTIDDPTTYGLIQTYKIEGWIFAANQDSPQFFGNSVGNLSNDSFPAFGIALIVIAVVILAALLVIVVVLNQLIRNID